jgi:hypothetical protein
LVLTPANKIILREIILRIKAVPISGCAAIKIIGTSIKKNGLIKSYIPYGPVEKSSLKNFARINITAILASSEG